MSILVNPQWLMARIDSNRAPVILDVRWYRDHLGGYDHYLEHHIPNAIYVDLEQDLTGAHNPARGRRPFPTKEKVQELTRRWGIDKDSYVVVYDSVEGTSAARVWWILRNAGVKDVFFLDGGLQRWEHAGMPTLTGPGIIPLDGNFKVSDEPCMPTVDVEEVAEWPQHGILWTLVLSVATRGILNITMLDWDTSRVPIIFQHTEIMGRITSSWTLKVFWIDSRHWVLQLALKWLCIAVPVTLLPTLLLRLK